MSVGISFEELLAWNGEAAANWKQHFETHPQLLELSCGIGGAATVQELVRHIWGAELRWAERLAGTSETPRESIPSGPLEALYSVHLQANGIYRNLLAAPAETWESPYILKFDWVPPDRRSVSRRKIAGHAFLHSQRHWAQLATLVRSAGVPFKAGGDLIFSSVLS